MSTPNRSFADRLFALGFRVAFKFFRRTDTKAVATEPCRADGQQPTVGTLDWFAPSPGGARTWDEAFAAASDAQRQQANQPID